MAESMPTPTPVTEFPDYNEDPNGGNVLTQNLNAPYDKVRFPSVGSMGRDTLNQHCRETYVGCLSLPSCAGKFTIRIYLSDWRILTFDRQITPV